MDKKIMKLLGVCLFAVASVGVLTACSDNDAENPEGGKPGGEDVNPAPEVVEFVNSNLVSFLRQPCFHEVSIMMCYLFNGTVHRIPVGMYIHNAHEDGYH